MNRATELELKNTDFEYVIPELEIRIASKSDKDIGIAFLRNYGDDIRYVCETKKWYIWNGKIWKEDTENHRYQMLFDFAEEMLGKPWVMEDEKIMKKLVRIMDNKPSEQIMAAITKLDGKHKVTLAEFQSREELINMNNCTIELDKETGEFSIREHRREDHLTSMLDYDYDETAKCPIYMNTMDKITMSDPAMKELFCKHGIYCFTCKNRERLIFIFYGATTNGKSVYLNMLDDMMGDYSGIMDSSFIMKGSNKNSTMGLSDYEGKRSAFIDELEDGNFDSVRLKVLTNPKLRLEKKYANTYEADNGCKLTIATNVMPKIQADDEAMFKRIRLIPMDYTFTEADKDNDILDKLRAERSGILNIFLSYYKKYVKEGFRVLPERVLRANKEYRDECDSVGEYLSLECRRNSESMIKGTELKKSFEAYIIKNGYNEKPMNIKEFYRILVKKGFQIIKRQRATYIQGLEINNDVFGS